MNAFSVDRRAFRSTKVDPKPPVDWETSATFFDLRKSTGDMDVLAQLERAYTDRSGGRRIFLAMGTVKRRPRQCLHLGIIRIAIEPPLPAQGRLL